MNTSLESFIVYPEAVSAELCDKIVVTGEKIDPKPGKVATENGFDINTSKRIDKIAISYTFAWRNFLKSSFGGVL